MGNILRKAVEDRRKTLIQTLLSFHVYKKEDKHLFELSLSELEREYKKVKSDNHPHSEMSSLQWINKKA